MTGNPDPLGVMVTRPEPQCETLCRLIEECGGMAVRWPAIVIGEHRPEPGVVDLLARADDADLAIFVSRNAVARGVPLLSGAGQLRIVGIGPSTERALQAAGLRTALESSGFDTEALLQHDGLADLSGRNVFIFRGVGGREALGEELRIRGAAVHYVEVYRRQPRSAPPGERAALKRSWSAGAIHVYTATSVEILDALYSELGADFAPLLSCTPLVTASRRVVQRSEALRHRAERILAPGPDDRSLVEAIASWSGRLRNPADRQEQGR